MPKSEEITEMLNPVACSYRGKTVEYRQAPEQYEKEAVKNVK